MQPRSFDRGKGVNGDVFGVADQLQWSRDRLIAERARRSGDRNSQTQCFNGAAIN